MVTQAINRTVTLEARNATDDFDFGPTDSVQAGSVLITEESLNTVGGVTPRVGFQWELNVQLYYSTTAGVETGYALTNYTAILFQMWDHIGRTVDTTTFTFTKDADQVTNPGLGVLSLASPSTVTPGMYAFLLQGSDGVNFEDLMSGWIEIKAALEP
jgi:hypothetical protein